MHIARSKQAAWRPSGGCRAKTARFADSNPVPDFEAPGKCWSAGAGQISFPGGGRASLDREQ